MQDEDLAIDQLVVAMLFCQVLALSLSGYVKYILPVACHLDTGPEGLTSVVICPTVSGAGIPTYVGDQGPIAVGRKVGLVIGCVFVAVGCCYWLIAQVGDDVDARFESDRLKGPM